MTRLRGVGLGLLGVLLLAAVWDLYKSFGPADGVTVASTRVLPRTTELAMPHTWQMLQRLTEPVTSAGDSPSAFSAVFDASRFTLGIAARGWVIGVVVGLLLALLMSRFRLAEQSLLPWVVLSQTVPLIAIAPLVRQWGSSLSVGGFEWTSATSVTVIAAYLAFFPVAVGALRGLKSPAATHLDLMSAYGVGWWRSLLTLKVPSSVPFLLPALRLSAASAVIGTVVAEVSISLRGGIGRQVVEFAQSAGGDPSKAWAPIFGAVAVGLVAAGFVGLIGLALKPFRLSGAPA